MSAFDELDWNLSQAAAWVVYRERELIGLLANSEPQSFAAIGMYPTMWPPGRQEVGTLTDLRSALREGRLIARGYHVEKPDQLQTIPEREWADLELFPPFAYVADDLAKRRQRWRSIRVDSSDMKRLWRSDFEVSGRTRHDWPKIEKIYRELKQLHPAMSQNELILELQSAVEAQLRKNAPSRSTIQSRIKGWPS